MPMMQIRIVCVSMASSLVTMPVRMWLGHRLLVTMLMMLVVDMAMLMFQRLMLVFVGVALRKMNP